VSPPASFDRAASATYDVVAIVSSFLRAIPRFAQMEAHMSWNPSLDPVCPDAVAVEAIDTLIVPRARDIGDFEVRRALPAPKRQMVGPFIFFDQMGPAGFISGHGVDVRPHPHIGLATVTYLFRGELQHRDSLGSNQIILPGEVNWMVAGRSVTHSERTSAAMRKAPHSLLGIQGSISVAGQAFEAGRMMVFRPGDRISVAAGPAGARLILLGGATLGGPRYIWWNFVASSQERIETAKEQWRKADWGRGMFDLPPDDRDEFTPLPPVRS
jgi:redox-sensitive bicupin YhaK (pirin superfamily)